MELLFGATVAAAILAAVVAAAASVQFLRIKDFFYDSLALAATEIGLALLAAGIVGRVVGGRLAGGEWWTWDSRLTAALVCWLLYVAYVLLRNAIEEPTQRASAAAVLSVFVFLDAPIVVVAVQWWRARHGATAGVLELFNWTLLPVLIVGAALTWMRLRKEQQRREQDAQRRSAFAL